MKVLVVGGSGFIGSYLMREIEADNLDLKNGKDARNRLPDDYDIIIFLACDQDNTKEAYEDNLKMYERLNELRKNYSKIPYLIYISSAAVYNLTNWYALSKQLGEAYAQRFSNYAILRLSNVYGHGDGHGAPDRFMRGENNIHGNGKQTRDLIPVELVVSKIINFLDVRTTGIFNISSGVATSVNQMFKIWGMGEPQYIEHDTGVMDSVLRRGRVYAED